MVQFQLSQRISTCLDEIFCLKKNILFLKKINDFFGGCCVTFPRPDLGITPSEPEQPCGPKTFSGSESSPTNQLTPWAQKKRASNKNQSF